ncbi:unnamed protein product [Prorocentrum cordatum]|uniref:Uncharacterized protein n=1 Tax=Prorocentrum cordatum TaxID=2364126 RepID=A0ABN9UEU8_9DINO|nr:unnamed protein product [Polarella glacialis]
MDFAVVQVTGPIKKMIADYDPSADDPSKGQMKAKADQICEMLYHAELGYFERIKSQHSVVDCCNRWGMGVDPVDVHSLLSRIIHQGWSDNELETPRCFEIIPSKADEVFTFNQKLWSASAGQLAPVVKHDMRISTVTCSHTAAGQKAVLAGCASNDSALSTDGALCRAKVAALSPSYDKSLSTGIPWFVIRHQVASAIPELPDFLSEAGNIGHGNHRKQTHVQAMLAVHSKAMKNMAVHGDYKLDAIARSVEAQMTHMEGQIRDIGEFVIQWGGGSTPINLECIEEYSKVLSFRRELPNALIRGLATLQFTQCPDYVVAVVKASLSAPDNFCKGSVAKLFNTSDISNISRKRAETLAAQEKMVAAKQWLRQFRGDGTSAGDAARLYGNFQVRLVMCLHSKRAPHRERFDDTKAVCQKLLQETFAKFPQARESQLPWDLESGGSDGPPSGVMREFGIGGLTIGALKDAGMVVGTLIRLKVPDDPNNKQHWKITGIADGKIELELHGEVDAPKGKGRGKGRGKGKQTTETVKLEPAKLMDDYEVAPQDFSFTLASSDHVATDPHRQHGVQAARVRRQRHGGAQAPACPPCPHRRADL